MQHGIECFPNIHQKTYVVYTWLVSIILKSPKLKISDTTYKLLLKKENSFADRNSAKKKPKNGFVILVVHQNMMFNGEGSSPFQRKWRGDGPYFYKDIIIFFIKNRGGSPFPLISRGSCPMFNKLVTVLQVNNHINAH